MEQTNGRKLKKRTRRRDDDRRSITSLPNDILENIFSYFSIKLAVQMSLLSTSFKNSWIMSKFLDFDSDFATSQKREDYIAIIDRIIKLHTGPKVCRLRVSLDRDYELSTVEEWVRFAVIKEVEELDLDLYNAGRFFEIPSFLFNCTTLNILKLSLCTLRPPPLKFSGLGSLKILHLRKVDLMGGPLDVLFSNSSLLECLDLWQCSLPNRIMISHPLPKLRRLCMVDCHNLYVVDLDAPNLSSLNFYGIFPEFNLRSGFSKINMVMLKFTKYKAGDCSRVKMFLFDLAHVDVITISSSYLQLLPPIPTNEKLKQWQIHFNNLKEFQLLMERDSFLNPLDVALLFCNCPCLERVFLDVQEFCFEAGIYWKLHCQRAFEQLNCLFRCLKTVKIKGFKLHKHEMLLVKLFLQKAVVLETIVLITQRRYLLKIHAEGLLDEQKLPRASPKAEVLVYKHKRDESCLQPIQTAIWKS